MSDDTNPNTTPNATTTPEAPAEETFTMTRAQMDAFRDRVLAEQKPAAVVQTPDDPLARYYAGVAERRAKEQPPKPNAPAGGSDLAELIALQKMALANQIAAMAPKAPEPIKPMTVDEKLAMRSVDTLLGRGPAGWTLADSEALRAKHEAELHRAGFTGDIPSEARRRASKQVLDAFSSVAANIRVTTR